VKSVKGPGSQKIKTKSDGEKKGGTIVSGEKPKKKIIHKGGKRQGKGGEIKKGSKKKGDRRRDREKILHKKEKKGGEHY